MTVSKKIKILEFTGEPIGTGGQEMFIVNMLRNLDTQDMTIDWATPYECSNDIYRSEIESRGGSVCSFGLIFKPGGNRINIVKPLVSFLRENRYDVIHIHSGSITVLAYASFAARIANVSHVIVHSHSTGLKKGIKYYILKALTLPIFSCIKMSFCACSVSAAQWKFPSSIVREKLVVLNNGIDLNVFKPNVERRVQYRERMGIRKDTIVLGHVGRLSFVKNQLFLIDVTTKMLSKGYDCELILVGEGEDRTEIEKAVKENQVEDKVILIGAVSNVQDYMQMFDVFLFPSRWEGLGLVAIEAQAVGLPVIASKYVPKEMKLTDHVTYLGIDDVDAWIEEILRVNGERYDSVTSIIEKGYSVRDSANKLRQLYLS